MTAYMTNRCTLIIDGNWLLMSRLGPHMKDFTSTDDRELVQASNNLVDLLAQSVNKIINYFGDNIDNVMMVQDGGSWRKHYPKPSLYTEVYKGNRVAQEQVNWDYIWKALRQLCVNFHDNGITCTQQRDIEGDDWCWFWSRYLNHNDTNVIIWSSDCDLKQLVQRDASTNRWTIWYNDRAGLCVHDCYNPSSIGEVDMFFEHPDPSIDHIVSNTTQRGEKVSYVIPDFIRMDKIICGDVGDNIKPVITTSKNDRAVRVSSREWERVRAMLNIDSIEQLYEHRVDVVDELLKTKRLCSCTNSKDDILDLMDYNYHMVVLDKVYIPEEQRIEMRSHADEYKVADLDYIRNNYKVLGSTGGQDTIQSLFDDIN